MTTLLVCIGDTHIGSKRGLCLPSTSGCGPEQEQLWGWWLQFWGKMKRQRCDKLVVVANGDLIDLNRHDQLDSVTLDRSELVELGYEVYKPLVDYADEFVMLGGTEAHSGKHHELESLLAARLGVRIDWWRGLSVDGVTFDICHKPATGTRLKFRRRHAAARHAEILVHEGAMSGGRPADYAIRSHLHWFQSSGDKIPPCMIYCPAWQLDTAFGHNGMGIGGWREPVGGLWFRCEDGRATWDVELFPKRGGDATRL